jgi:glycosyltransferase involved in cell wall biosynthesis
MRVVFLNRFYWPDEPATGQLLTDLAEALAARGHDVTVIASRPARSIVPERETRHGVRIERVHGTRAAGRRLRGKAWDFATFYFAALWRLCSIARRGTTVVAMTDPPLLGIGTWLVARLRGARVVHWVQDIYPELAIELAGQRWLRLIRPLRNHTWRDADHVVTLGQDMAGVLADAGVAPRRLTLVPNWGPHGVGSPDPAAVARLRLTWGLEGKFVVAYSGNLGRVHDLEPVLAAAELLRGEPGIVFIFVGDGAQRATLEADATRRGLSQVRFLAAQPRDRLAAALGVGDVHLVTLRPGCERYVFPSKLHGIAAVGRPALFVGPPRCEIAQLAAERGLGRAVSRDDPAALAAAIRALAADAPGRAAMGAAGIAFAREHSPTRAADRWERVLAALET